MFFMLFGDNPFLRDDYGQAGRPYARSEIS